MAGDVLSFGTMNTSQNRFFWRGAYSAGTIYNAYDVVSYLGSAYISLSTQTGVLPTNTGSWDQMTSAGAVSSVAGRVGNVVLSAADLTNGVTGTGAVVLATAPTVTQLNLSGTRPSGLVTEASGALIDFGINDSRFGTITLSDQGGFIRADSRAGNPLFSLWGRPATSSTLSQLVSVDSTTGTVNAFGGFQVNGSALAFTNIAGTVAASQLPNPAATAKGGVQSKAAVAHNFLTAINTDGTVSQAQPAFTDISGTVAATQLPNPTASTLGGVQSFAAQASKWINSISTSGVPSATQPASTDLSDVATLVTLTGTQTITNKTVGAGGLAGLTPSKQIFTTSGTFTIPTGVKAVKVTVLGGGGAGGGATSANNGGGGGAGGAAIKWLSGLTPGNTLAVTVGSGGAGASGLAGNAGGASSIASGTQTITTVTGNGGAGGNTNGSISGGGGGGTATNGDLNFGGQSGFFSNSITGGPGAPSIFGGGGPDSNGGNPGNAAVASGAGGGGAGVGASRAGGAGGAGVVIIEWTI